MSESGRARNGGQFLRHPTVIVFGLGLVGAIVGWAVRQEIVNINQQNQIDDLARTEAQRLAPVEVARRLGNLEGRITTLEKLLPSK